LCDTAGGRVVGRTDRWRLIHAGEAGFPAFYRVVWNAHVAEFSDLPAAERAECMEAVVAVEQALRTPRSTSPAWATPLRTCTGM
jgi:diadenosine tetraphosphate (Ap4A) HIT family hydrolase